MPRYAPAPDNYSQYVADNGSSYYMYDEHDHHHLRDINTLIAPSPWDYDALGDFIKLHGVPVKRITKDSCEARMTAIESWAVSHGYRLIHTISVE
jgi:hypothetical protein